MIKNRKKILGIFSHSLGHKTLSNLYKEEIDRYESAEFLCIEITGEDYQRFPITGLKKLSSTWQALYLTKKKVESVIGNRKDFDLLIVVGFEGILALKELTQSVPTVLIHDTTSVLSNQMIAGMESSLSQKVRAHMSMIFLKRRYRMALKNVDVFLPISEWCGESLVRDFGVSEDRMRVVYPGLDLSVWGNEKKEDNGRIRLLFVGNAFSRKGGAFLLSLYSKELRGFCDLTIVSNDDSVREDQMPPGARLLRSIPYEEMKNIYNSSDVLVLPSKRDQLPHVLIEACASGMAIAANDIGAVKEVVESNRNGFLMPVASTSKQWAEKIKYLHEHRDTLKEFKNASRKMAEQKFCIEVFKRHVRDVISRCLEGKDE